MLRVSFAAAFTLGVAAWDDISKHPWFKKDIFKETGRFLTYNGFNVRIPTRVTQEFFSVYGSAEPQEVMKDLESDIFTPVLVGGKAVVETRLINIIDSDYGNDGAVNPLFEAAVFLIVSPKTAPISLPYNDWKSWQELNNLVGLNLNGTLVSSMVMRVTCSSSSAGPIPAMTAVAASRGYGIPKHHALGGIRYDYEGDGGRFLVFNMVHQGTPALAVRAKLPKLSPKAKRFPCSQDVRGGLLTPVLPLYQARYGGAWDCTLLGSPWDPAEDELSAHTGDDWLGSMLKRWNFQPKLKLHSMDAKQVVYKLVNFLPRQDVAAQPGAAHRPAQEL